MMFLNYGLGMDTALDTTPVNADNTIKIELANGIYDEVYVDKNTDRNSVDEIPDWTYSTVLDAKFNGNLLAGNIDFAFSAISAIIVKKRKQGDYKWTTLAKVPIQNADDLSFYLNDITSASNTTYEYAAVPVVNGAEGAYQTITVESCFDGAFILDDAHGYQIYLNFERPSLTRQIQPNIVTTANNKYPYTFYTSKSNYETITLSGTFIEIDNQTGDLKTKEASRYRKAFKDFLTDRKPKIAKIYDGQIWMCAVSDNISESSNGYHDNVVTTINLTEIGDVESNKDLYYNGFANYLEVHL